MIKRIVYLKIEKNKFSKFAFIKELYISISLL